MNHGRPGKLIATLYAAVALLAAGNASAAKRVALRVR